MYHGANRLHLADAAFGDADIVLSTYDILRRDWQAEGPLYGQEWYRVVLDEGSEPLLIPLYLSKETDGIFSAPCTESDLVMV